jgi:hypothetical protein
LSLPHSVQTVSGTNPARYLKGNFGGGEYKFTFSPLRILLQIAFSMWSVQKETELFLKTFIDKLTT